MKVNSLNSGVSLRITTNRRSRTRPPWKFLYPIKYRRRGAAVAVCWIVLSTSSAPWTEQKCWNGQSCLSISVAGSFPSCISSYIYPPFPFRHPFPQSLTSHGWRKTLRRVQRRRVVGEQKERKGGETVHVAAATKPRIYECHPNFRWKETRSDVYCISKD